MFANGIILLLNRVVREDSKVWHPFINFKPWLPKDLNIHLYSDFVCRIMTMPAIKGGYHDLVQQTHSYTTHCWMEIVNISMTCHGWMIHRMRQIMNMCSRVTKQTYWNTVTPAHDPPPPPPPPPPTHTHTHTHTHTLLNPVNSACSKH